LYDLEQDPRETRNVAAEHPDVVQRIEVVVKRSHTPSEIP
jgi:hypothetical protein